MTKIERDKIHYGVVTLLDKELKISKTRSILYTSESFLTLNNIAEDILYESPKYSIKKDIFEAQRSAKIFPQEKIYILKNINLYYLLRYFGFSETLTEKDCLALKENLFNGKFGYENSELFGYHKKTNAYWKNGILITKEYPFENDKYDFFSYEKFADNDLTPYFPILSQIPYQNSEEIFVPFPEEGIIRKRSLKRNEGYNE